MSSNGRLSAEERALILRLLRDARLTLSHRIEIQKSQRRRGLPGANEEQSRLQKEYALLDSAIRKLWTGGS